MKATPSSLLQNGEQHLTVHGIKHWYRIAGAEHHTTPLVIVHGGPGGNLYSFERTVGPLLEQFATVVYYEQRGSGRSDAPEDKEAYSIPLLVDDLDTLRQELGLGTIIPLGFSFGGWLALEYALAHPKQVEQVVIVGPSNGDEARVVHTQLSSFRFVAQGAIKERVEEILRGPGTAEERLDQIRSIADSATFDRLLFHQPEAAAFNRRLWNESGLRNTGDMHRALQKQPDPRLLDRLPQMQSQALCIVGLHDRNTGVEMARDLVFSMPNAELVIFENSAHFPDIEESERFASVVKNFLSSR